MKKGAGRAMLYVILAIVLVPLVAGALYALYETRLGNFHEITEGEAYRSAQMSGPELRQCIDRYHIRSILNLRGRMPGEKWYDEELQVSAQAEVKHYDLCLSSSSELSAEETRTLRELFLAAPRPILIHCQGGADRSGLVAAMWKVIVDRESKNKAGKQLSIFYGHMPVGPPSAMDRFFAKWRPEELAGSR